MSRKTRIHLDDSLPGQAMRRGLCGWLAKDGSTATDLTQVTCKICLERFRTGTRSESTRAKPGKATDLAREVATELEPLLTAKAGPPPRVTPQVWAASCKGAEDGRCRSEHCSLCEWDRWAEVFAFASPWEKRAPVQRPEGSPRWPSLAAALVALAEYERHGRCGASATGGILARIELGPIDGITRDEDALMRRGAELVAVRVALDHAYPDDGHALPSAKRKALLMARTPGVMKEQPTYEQLSVELGESVGELRALVRAGRALVQGELERRGLIPESRVVRRAV